MAAIDKTYVNSWQDYCDFKKWAKINKFDCPDGNVIDFSRKVEGYKEEEVERTGGVVLMTTSCKEDFFLIKYCPLEFVQEWMKVCYDDDYFQGIKEGVLTYENLFINKG